MRRRDSRAFAPTTRLKLPDCCVVLAAQQRAAAVLTFDDRLAAACERLGVPLAGAER